MLCNAVQSCVAKDLCLKALLHSKLSLSSCQNIFAHNIAILSCIVSENTYTCMALLFVVLSHV